MEDLVSEAFWRGKRVLVTGHTGFKGGWLSLWLNRLGAEVHGLALDPPTTPSLFESAAVASVLASDTRNDIRDMAAVHATFQRVQPQILLHLAAQSLVSYSYEQPVETYAVNVIGTAQVLDAARQTGSVRAILVITTDKCYDNKEWVYPYRENDALGGFDPYSNSKACAELVVAAYRSSYFNKTGTAIATARAGNVIGGGDWAENRLIPDCVRAFVSGNRLDLRYPQAVRPWQHVLEPLAGYLRLTQLLYESDAGTYGEPWNFGPAAEDTASVGEVASLAAGFWNEHREISIVAAPHHEAGMLRLDSSKARERLDWIPRWPLRRALKESLAWYRAWSENADMKGFSLRQIDEYQSTASV